ncbi:MAG: NAD(P)/FAD-dependent oxidoreductase [Clostridiales bacterium]|nr:NAD(P)/FAD-dependent oxidoreductase [Clostridiales bacterium]
MGKVVVVGGGAAGMFAAYASALYGNETILLEKNEKLGKKIYITGKGRCNLTTTVDKEEFFNSIVRNSKFMFSAMSNLSPEDTFSFFENSGLPLKVERGNRVFPASDKASDVTKTLEKCLIQLGVDIRLNTPVTSLKIENSIVCSVITENSEIECDSVIVCCGGISYPLTGSCGDGYKFAKAAGHNVVDLRPSLVGVELLGADYLQMQGLSLKNVALYVRYNGKKIYEDFGEMLFTHFGISGPIVLSCSSKINRLDLSQIELVIDLKPALDTVTLDSRLLREFKENNSKSIFAVMRALLPKSLINVVLDRANIKHDKSCSEITVLERQAIINSLKNLTFKPKKLRPVEEAIVTSGGVDVKEINPKTMESKLIKGLFFAGEVLDVDAFTGGFNLQLAFSTGYTAGINA